ncbi:MAG: hypothetical protein HY275_03340 [Gemmatimonadetes bacterium]|nr:hypothetical protein [Gemmatimonadota bacterium]
MLPAATRAQQGATVTLDLATIHAQALTAARGKGDTTDAPFLLVSVVRDAAHTASQHLPAAPHWTIVEDQALPSVPLTQLTLAPGDTVRVLLSLLEHDKVTLAEATRTGESATQHLTHAASPLGAPTDAQVASGLAPLVRKGAHWIGSATFLLTNEGGTLYWREFGCVHACAVVKNPGKASNEPLALAADAKAAAAVVELSGDKGTYHMQVTARRGA